MPSWAPLCHGIWWIMINSKKIFIRADGNAKIGAGHLMRCLTIAGAFTEKQQIEFVCADEESAALARSGGFATQVLHTDYGNMEAELPAWAEMFGGGTGAQVRFSRVILVDSYYVTNAYLTALGCYGAVVLLDDMIKQSWNADAIINYNAFARVSMYEALGSPYKTVYYAGSSYIPIRREFCNRAYKVRGQVEHILITTGGGDAENIAGQILDKIWEKSREYHVVTGHFNPHYESLLEQSAHEKNIHIYHDVKDMAALMERCDLAVTAGGTTVYELSAIGVPFVCFSYAENQEMLTEYIGRKQIAGFGGAYHKEAEQTLETIKAQIEILQEDVTLRRKYSEEERRLVDGEGAARIAAILFQIHL